MLGHFSVTELMFKTLGPIRENRQVPPVALVLPGKKRRTRAGLIIENFREY
jgi:hypothetical protein